MSGINAIFHAGSALAAVLLVWLLLRLRRQRELLRRLVLTRGGAHVASPCAYLRGLAVALGVPFEQTGPDGEPARIDAGPWRDFIFRRRPTLIRCHDAEIEVHVDSRRDGGAPGAGPDDGAGESAGLTAALGGRVAVRIVIAKEFECDV